MIIVSFTTLLYFTAAISFLPLSLCSFRFISFCRLRLVALVVRLPAVANNRHNASVPSSGRERQNPVGCPTPQI
jgi:hypothetical protein